MSHDLMVVLLCIAIGLFVVGIAMFLDWYERQR